MPVTPDDHIAKLNEQVGALNRVVIRMDERTASTHRIVVATSIVGPAHRATLGVGLLGCLLGVVALVVALTSCQPRTPAQAEAAYTAEQTACVVDCHARHESISCVRACRDASDEKWGLVPRKGSR